MNTRIRARITGRVQGVGFRPTVYRYATELGLAGFVCNDAQGVTVEVEGDDLKVGAFFEHLVSAPPPQARIVDIEKQVCERRGTGTFEVVESEFSGDAATHISPDLATCDDCLRELQDAGDRRYEYPFINCTNCGPRFTIIRDVPYDRVNTSMAGFAMCDPCEHEYRQPADRRFHAQPNACPDCGPQLNRPIRDVVPLLRAGRIVAIKSLGGYHLACDALNPSAVARLRERKRRPHKALAVMFRDLDTLRRYCDVSEAEEAELLSVARPIVVLRSSDPALQRGVSPDSPTIGAFLPFTPLHHLLMEDFDALVMTSGNRSNEPIVSDEVDLAGLLGSLADAALTHNRPILHKCDDSVVRVFHGQRQFLRRARGFVPNPIRIAPASGAPHILAVGGELKNTFCLVRDGFAFVSQHIGDLKDFKTYEHFNDEMAAWQALMRVEPAVIAHDLHPAYLSTRFAVEATGPAKIAVQHHHAHIASVMAEHDLHEPVIGIALDGTGYGTDGTIWGGEFMIADRLGFERVAHFKAYPLPGGDRAIEEPWRMAVSVLHTEGLDRVARVLAGSRDFDIVSRMIDAEFNAPPTTSAGRLFDAVAGILSLCDRVTYEAQGAIRLEAVADPRVTEAYPCAVEKRDETWTVDFGPAIRALVQDQAAGAPIGVMAGKFHNTVVAALLQRCKFIRAARGLHTVALSGGVFQNARLLTRALDALRAAGFEVFTNVTVPPNDGGLALGQAAVAAARLATPARPRRMAETCV